MGVSSLAVKEKRQMDEVKRVLVQKYACDESVLFDEEGKEIALNADEEEDHYISNRQFSQQQQFENMQ